MANGLHEGNKGNIAFKTLQIPKCTANESYRSAFKAIVHLAGAETDTQAYSCMRFICKSSPLFDHLLFFECDETHINT